MHLNSSSKNPYNTNKMLILSPWTHLRSLFSRSSLRCRLTRNPTPTTRAGTSPIRLHPDSPPPPLPPAACRPRPPLLPPSPCLLDTAFKAVFAEPGRCFCVATLPQSLDAPPTPSLAVAVLSAREARLPFCLSTSPQPPVAALLKQFALRSELLAEKKEVETVVPRCTLPAAVRTAGFTTTG